MPRPVKNKANRLNRHLPPVRCTEDEYAMIQSKAAQAGITVSEFLRRMALRGQITIRRSTYGPAVAEQLRRIGVNINQQTKRFNSTDEMPPELYRLWQKLDVILNEIIDKM